MKKGLIQFVSDGYSSDGMTSLQIATRIGRRHQHVMRDIRAILDKGVDASNFGLISYIRNFERPMNQVFTKTTGKLVNAEQNGALIIMRKVVGDSYVRKIVGSGHSLCPIRYRGPF